MMYFIVSSSLSYYFLTAVWVPFSAFSLATSDVLRTRQIVTLPTLLMALRGLFSGSLGLITGTPKSCHPEALLTIVDTSTALGIILPSFGVGINEELPDIPELLGKLRHRISSFRSALMAVIRIVRTFYIVFLIPQTHLDQLMSK